MVNIYTLFSKKYSPIISLSIFSLFLFTFIAFPINDAYSFEIYCAPDTDFEKYPICEYEELWNESELFNKLVAAELAERENDINADPNSFQKIYSDSIKKINDENSGLYDKGQEIKDWIFRQIAQKAR